MKSELSPPSAVSNSSIESSIPKEVKDKNISQGTTDSKLNKRQLEFNIVITNMQENNKTMQENSMEMIKL